MGELEQELDRLRAFEQVTDMELAVQKQTITELRAKLEVLERAMDYGLAESLRADATAASVGLVIRQELAVAQREEQGEWASKC